MSTAIMNSQEKRKLKPALLQLHPGQRSKKNQASGHETNIQSQYSHHEEDASTVRCAGALHRVFFWFQTQRAQDQTQDVAHHHQEDHTA